MADTIKIEEISKIVKPATEEAEVTGNFANQLDLKVHNQFLETEFDANAPIYITASVTPMRKTVMSKTSDMQEIENKLFDRLDALLAEDNPDYSLILDEIFKIISVLTRNSEKMDREAVQVRIKALFDKVRDVQDTFNSKRGIVLAAVSASLLFASGICSLGAGIDGTNLGTVLDLNAKNLGNLSKGASSFSQIPGTFTKLDDEVKQSKRQGLQAEQEEYRRKLTQDQESGQRKKAQQDKAVQNLKDTIEKWDRTFTEFTR